MRKVLALAVLFCMSASPSWSQAKEEQRVEDAGQVIKEIAGMPDGIPRDLLNKAECIVVMPAVKKAAFIVGASYGRGVMVCRAGADMTGRWGAPAMMALEGGSFGFQAGGNSTDYVMLIMNERGAKSMMSSKVKLGADASIAAGPVGRTAGAATDVVMTAQILSYSRSKGVFAGVSLEGSTCRSDGDANKSLYGKDLSAQQILLRHEVKPPKSAALLLSTLNRLSPMHKK